MRLVARLVVLGLLAAGASAHAQLKPAPKLDGHVPTGSHIKKDPTSLEGDRLNRYFDDMAKCLVRRSPDKADSFMRQSDDFGISDEIGDVTKFLPLPACVADAADLGALQVEARFSPIALRNWLSEELYLASNRQFAAFDPAIVPPERPYYSRTALLRAQTFGAFSDCIVTEDAAGADGLVRTRRGSDEEKAAARALVPAMAKCLPKDQTITLTPPVIRGFAAQGLWQRYEAPKPARFAGSAR